MSTGGVFTHSAHAVEIDGRTVELETIPVKNRYRRLTVKHKGLAVATLEPRVREDAAVWYDVWRRGELIASGVGLEGALRAVAERI